MVMSLHSKWAADKARGGRISKSIRNRRATQSPAHFQRNPLGRGQLAVFPRCSLLTYQSRYARRSRLEKQPTDRRRRPRYLWDSALGAINLHAHSNKTDKIRSDSLLPRFLGAKRYSGVGSERQHHDRLFTSHYEPPMAGSDGSREPKVRC